MTIRYIPAALAVLALFGFSSAVDAKGKGKQDPSARILSRFDKDQDGKIDGKEAEKVKAIYAALASLDTNHDGVLSDSEIAAAKISTGGKKGGKGKKGKNVQTTAPTSSSSSSSAADSATTPAK